MSIWDLNVLLNPALSFFKCLLRVLEVELKFIIACFRGINLSIGSARLCAVFLLQIMSLV
jgi:hypothetical protein